MNDRDKFKCGDRVRVTDEWLSADNCSHRKAFRDKVGTVVNLIPVGGLPKGTIEVRFDGIAFGSYVLPSSIEHVSAPSEAP